MAHLRRGLGQPRRSPYRGRMTTRPAPAATVASETDGHLLPPDLAREVARQLEDSGEYRATVDPGDPQRLVDLRWAALGAGRLLGRRLQLVMTKAVEAGDAPITVRVTARPGHRHVVPRQRHRA